MNFHVSYPEWRKSSPAFEQIQKARHDMAAAYRKLRQDSPRMARLLFKIQKRHEAVINDAIWGDTLQDNDGLAGLLVRDL
jgi:hypothetical protein